MSEQEPQSNSEYEPTVPAAVEAAQGAVAYAQDTSSEAEARASFAVWYDRVLELHPEIKDDDELVATLKDAYVNELVQR